MQQNNIFNKVRKLLLIAIEISKMRGIYFVIDFWVKMLIGCLLQYLGWPLLYYYKRFKSSRTFTFQGRNYKYFYHRLNTTWRNERAVEIPIIWEMMREYQEERILEIGNVLSRYFHIRHDVLNKYEKGENVINQDVFDFQLYKEYDLIVSISTLEHVDWYWYDNPRNYSEKRILLVIKNLIDVLALRGKLVVTLPVDYNFRLDNLIKEGEIKFTNRYCLKRVSADNEWIEASWEGIQNTKYGKPFPGANALIIGIIEKK